MILTQEINFCDPVGLFRGFSDMPWAIFLDSALMSAENRYSFIGIDPFLKLQSKHGQISVNQQVCSGNPFLQLKNLLKQYPLVIDSNLCPFQGGIMGYFGYDLCQHLEKLPQPLIDDMKFPDISIGFYDLVVGFDLLLKKAWVFSSGYPEQDNLARQHRATMRTNFLLEKIKSQTARSPLSFSGITGEIQSNFTAASYQAAVGAAIEYILAGDIFQVNLSQRFSAKLSACENLFGLYERLRLVNPAPFAAYLNFSPTYIISSSPEQFLQTRKKQVKTKPIKGTMPRGKTPELDQAYAEKLLASEKDRAENIMIVDLMRNDLSRVCENHSVYVTKLCELESFSTVHHLVSTVVGQLRTDQDSIDLLTAVFPGGSVTGAPKIRAMEIITEIEQYARGPYCGSIGYIGFNNDMDVSIAIRTLAIQNDRMVFQAGGAIVADSDPVSEYQETLDKARALIQCLDQNL